MTVEELRQLKQDVEKFGTYSAYVQNEAKKHSLEQEDILPYINRNKILLHIADCFTAPLKLVSMFWREYKEFIGLLPLVICTVLGFITLLGGIIYG